MEVASFGDFFADRDGPKNLPAKRRVATKKDGVAEATETVKSLTEGAPPSPVKALTYKDPFQQVYKKYLFTPDGKYLLGGMMIGDTKDYVKLVPMVKNQKPLEVSPSEFIIGKDSGMLAFLLIKTKFCIIDQMQATTMPTTLTTILRCALVTMC